MDPDRACPHEDFAAVVEVNRLTKVEGGPVTGYSAEITVRCADCDEPFRWIGCPAGLSPRQPMVSPDEATLRARACAVVGRNLTRSEWDRFLPGKSYRRTCDQWPAAG